MKTITKTILAFLLVALVVSCKDKSGSTDDKVTVQETESTNSAEKKAKHLLVTTCPLQMY